ncbi:MAG: hypothetical protein AB1916_04515 [Thermodesulfobacteriota bacterium]
MDAPSLRLSERFRPWHAAGLRYLFRPAPAPAPASAAPAPRRAPAQDSGEPWTGPWKAYRRKLAAPSRTVWTYADLGLDLGSRPDPERRDLFKLIIHFLKWPKGSVTFWPVAAETDHGLAPDPDRFWRGVAESQARTVIVFGRRALAMLFPEETFAPRILHARGLSVVVLPGPSDLLPDNRQAKKIVWDTLRNLPLG